jgi:predicted metal-dependent hydrolase
MNDLPLTQAIVFFNAEQYRDALLVFEAYWHANRKRELQALILLSNALNQLRLGLVAGPQRNLASASRLLSEGPDMYEGICLRTVRGYIVELEQRIASFPDGQVVEWGDVPRIRL